MREVIWRLKPKTVKNSNGEDVDMGLMGKDKLLEEGEAYVERLRKEDEVISVTNEGDFLRIILK